MKTYIRLKAIAIALLFLCSIQVSAQVLIASQTFDGGASGYLDDLNYSVTDASVNEVVSNYSYTSPNSLRMEGNGTGDQDYYLTFNNIDITSYSNVEFSIAYASFKLNNNDDLILQYSYNNGSSWTDILLVDGGNGGAQTVLWNELDDANSVSTNPYTFSVPNGNNNLQIRVRARNFDNKKDRIYIDNVFVRGDPNTTRPEIEVYGNGEEITNNDIIPTTIDDTDFTFIQIGSQIVRTFTLKNVGNANLNISSIGFSDSTNFSLSGVTLPLAIAGGSQQDITVTYDPTVIGIQTNNITINSDDADESAFLFRTQAESDQSFFDSDGDGVFDDDDIDDDNDGIRDEDEELNCQNSSISMTANYKFLEETFGSGTTRTTINTTYNSVTTYCYEDGTETAINTPYCVGADNDNLTDGEYTVYHKVSNGDGTDDTPTNEVASWADDYWYTGVDHTPGDTDGRMAIFNASFEPGTFYTATITGAIPNVPITYSFWVLNLDRSDAPCLTGCPGGATYDDNPRLEPNILVEFRDFNGNVLQSLTTGSIPATTAGNNAGDWYQFTANLTFSVGEFEVVFINNETGGLGNDLALDDIEISQLLCDTDGDNIADIYDLDSDNDGIPDVVENGLGNISGGKAQIDTWVDSNGNGMHDAAEGLPVIDTDGDGTPNYLDLDSDNDSIFDVDESGAGNLNDSQYQNGDGDIDGDGVGDGPDTDDVREIDTNSDGTSEYFSDGILDVYDYYNGSTLATAYGNFYQGTGNTYFVLDSDNDGIPNFLEVDSNNDGTYDIEETLYSSLDANNDGLIDDTNDADYDGIVDLFDTDDASFGSPRDLTRKLLLYFDGRNDYIQDSNVFNGSSEVSIMGWLKFDISGSGNQTLFGQDNFYLQLRSDNKIYATTPSNILVSDYLPDNTWIHIAAVYSVSKGAFSLYINGENITENAISSPLPGDTSMFTMGKQASSNSEFYRGYMDEVRIFNKGLTDNELQKMVYQEISDNAGIVRGTEVPKDISNFISIANDTPLPWSNLLRYYRLDNFKGDITDDLTTSTIDSGTGAKLYNIKIIDYQNAPMPFITQQNGTLAVATHIPSDGVNGNDAVTYDWSIVKIKHNNITQNTNHGHLALFVDQLDASNNPIKYTINGDSELNVSWYLNLDGKIDLEGESQLVQGSESTLNPNSTGTLERDQQGTQDLYTYNYWSSPVGATNNSTNNNSYTVPQIFNDGTDSAAPVNINFITNDYDGNSGSPIGIADYWIWKYGNLASNYYNWEHVRSTGSLQAGEGFTMKGSADTSGNVLLNQNYVLEGKPHNGEITLTIDPGNDYLVGNPYASAIDANEFITQNTSTTGTIYYWEHWGGGSHETAEYQGGYAMYNLSGGTPALQHDYSTGGDTGTGSANKLPGRYIPVAQGFFVTGSGTSGNIVFNNSQRVFQKEGANSTFMRTNNNSTTNDTEEIVDNRMKIRLGFNSINTYRRQILVTVDANATSQIDFGYDAETTEANQDDMYWMIEDRKFLIQGIDTIDSATILPLGVNTITSGLNTFKIDELINVPTDLEIYIYDAVTETYHDIKNNTNFSIDLPAGAYTDRFELRFSSNSLSTDDFIAEETGIQFYFANNNENIVINNPKLQNIKSVEIYSLLGQSIFKFDKIETQDYITLKTTNLSTGNYILNINTDIGKISKKVLVE